MTFVPRKALYLRIKRKFSRKTLRATITSSKRSNIQFDVLAPHIIYMRHIYYYAFTRFINLTLIYLFIFFTFFVSFKYVPRYISYNLMSRFFVFLCSSFYLFFKYFSTYTLFSYATVLKFPLVTFSERILIIRYE